uniref:Uncharacterized protein n=1 Tax=Siphoviridae sp. ctDmR33 TaxID=2825389 RepID=A0A8S5UX92_9CAUD|nr:MAG TPA: hypothetical protein [Siphoviridae sp. ctDmR33]
MYSRAYSYAATITVRQMVCSSPHKGAKHIYHA